MSTDVYRDLQRHLNTMPVGYPPTRTGVEIRLLKSIFSPEQARAVSHLSHKYQTIKQIFESARKDTATEEELRRLLDESVSRGGLSRRRRDGKEEYAIIPPVLWGIYEQQVKRLNAEFLQGMGEYLTGELGFELATSKLPKMRVIPIEESVEAGHSIATYDELRRLIEQAGDHIAVQECICKKSFDMMGKSCRTTDRRELCMSLGDLAELYVEEGWGRRISQQEALDLARQNEKEGLVLMPANEQQPEFICACCSDCCGMLGMIKNFPKPAEVVGSNFFARVDLERCKGCATCVDRCPMDAAALVDNHSAIDLKRCIGCGLCVPTCPEQALHLTQKKQESPPPQTPEELYDIILAQKSSLLGRLRNASLKTFLRLVTRLSKKSQQQTH